MTFTAKDVVEEARTWIGTPNVHQQRTKGVATDCIGFLHGLYEHFVGPFPRKRIVNYSPWWAEEGHKEILVSLLDEFLIRRDLLERAPGLIVAFSLTSSTPIKHVAVLAHRDRMIHTYGRHPIHETTICPWWERRIRRIYAMPDMEG